MISKHRIYSNIHRYGGMHPYSHMRITYSEAHQNTHGYSRHNKHTYTWTHAQIQGTHTSAHLDTHISETHSQRHVRGHMCRNTADSLLHMCESHATHTHEKHSEITSNDYKGWVRKCTHALMYTCMLKSMKSVCLPKKKKKVTL